MLFVFGCNSNIKETKELPKYLNSNTEYLINWDTENSEDLNIVEHEDKYLLTIIPLLLITLM